jgi:hypothetical protein
MRDDQLKTIAALSAAALAAALAGPAAAKDVKVDVDGKFYQLPKAPRTTSTRYVCCSPPPMAWAWRG